MNELEQAQKIASENGFELKEMKPPGGFWMAVHTVESDGVVFDMWQSYWGESPLLVARAAAEATYNPLLKGNDAMAKRVE